MKQTDKDKNFYFGQYTIDKRNGMGYYVSSKGNLYIGLFNNDQLKNGYSYQIDEVGLKTYFVVNNFIKTPIDYTEWEKFMLAYKKLQSIYNF